MRRLKVVGMGTRMVMQAQFLLVLSLALLLAGCAGGGVQDTVPSAPAATSGPTADSATVPPTPTLTAVSQPVLSTPAGEAQPLSTPEVDLMASAPPLPTQAVPLLPSPVASELPQAGIAAGWPPTPVCSNLALTPPDTEGPYFLDNTPERTSLVEPGMTGTPLTITGYVFTQDCRPVDRAQIEFWQAGPDGQYDLQGYRFRGHLFTDANGYYRLETILPAVYEGRPRHIHVKVLPPGAPVLTTQLYFPDDSPLPALTVAYDETVDGALAVFNFILP